MQIYDYKSKKTRKKLITQWINRALMALNSALRKYYKGAYNCSNILFQTSNSVSAKYCNARTCITCNGIRTANYIKNYGDQIFDFKNPQFVTLTAPTIWCTDVETLRYEIECKEKIWRKIYINSKKSRKGEIVLKGLKSMEITVRPDEFYHIHFHFIVEGKEEAEWLKSQWLNHNPNALPYLQNVKPLKNREGLLEVFKYGTKFSHKEKKMVNGEVKEVWKTIEPRRLDIVIQALYKKRLISTFGGVRKVKDDDVNDIVESISIEDLEMVEKSTTWLWFEESDWYNQDTGEKFSDFVPSEALKNAFLPNNKV